MANGRCRAPPNWLSIGDDELVRPFEYLAMSLYLTTVCLLDSKGLHAYLKQFYIKFGEKFDVKNAAEIYDLDHYWSGEPFNVFINDLKQFLAPFNIVGDSSRYLQLSGVQYLETILRNTATILHKAEITPTAEPEVYKAVRSVLEAIFPTAISPDKAKFFKNFKTYKPDILIPELSAVVEYKYANSEERLKSALAEIADDVKGYTGDSDYNLLYAVFYVKADFWGEEKFIAAWAEKQFPKNWQAFYVVGS